MYNVVHNAHCILCLSARSFSYMVQQDDAFSPLGLGIEPYQRRNFVLLQLYAMLLQLAKLSAGRRCPEVDHSMVDPVREGENADSC